MARRPPDPLEDELELLEELPDERVEDMDELFLYVLDPCLEDEELVLVRIIFKLV